MLACHCCCRFANTTVYAYGHQHVQRCLVLINYYRLRSPPPPDVEKLFVELN